MFRPLLILALIFGLTAGCVKKETVTEAGPVNSKSYQDLRKKYDGLLTVSAKSLAQSQAVQIRATLEIIALQDLDEKIADYNRKVEAYTQLSKTVSYEEKSTQYGEIAQLYRSMNELIANLEQAVLKAILSFSAQADSIYKDPSGFQNLYSQMIKKGETLVGIRGLLKTSFDSLKAPAKPAVNKTLRPETQPQHPSPARNEILLWQNEVDVAGALSSGKGIYRDANGGKITQLPSKQAALDLANHAGIDPAATADSYDLSVATGGKLGLASSAQDIGQMIVNFLAHIKAMMNSNSDNLELVFLLDYSGSMSDNIKAVIDNLLQITESAKAIKVAGRTVKIGIVTFGQQGKEKMVLNLTENLAQVQTTLNTLYTRYEKDKHSDDPGEAREEGLSVVAQSISWNSTNRKVILITDEPSKAVAVGDMGLVEKTQKQLKIQGIQINVYPLVIKKGF